MGNKVAPWHQLIAAVSGHTEPSGRGGNYVSMSQRAIETSQAGGAFVAGFAKHIISVIEWNTA